MLLVNGHLLGDVDRLVDRLDHEEQVPLGFFVHFAQMQSVGLGVVGYMGSDCVNVQREVLFGPQEGHTHENEDEVLQSFHI